MRGGARYLRFQGFSETRKFQSQSQKRLTHHQFKLPTSLSQVSSYFRASMPTIKVTHHRLTKDNNNGISGLFSLSALPKRTHKVEISVDERSLERQNPGHGWVYRG